MIMNWDFNCKDFGRCIDLLPLAAQPLYRISGHPEVFTAIIIIINTKVVAITREGRHTYERIRFNKGLPQGDVLCPRLLTICLNPVAWTISAAEGYRMSKPINSKVTGLLYIDDLKIFAASESN